MRWAIEPLRFYPKRARSLKKYFAIIVDCYIEISLLSNDRDDIRKSAPHIARMMDHSPTINNIKLTECHDKLFIENRSFSDFPLVFADFIFFSEELCTGNTRIIDINTYDLLCSKKNIAERHESTSTPEINNIFFYNFFLSSNKMNKIFLCCLDFCIIKSLQEVLPILSETEVISIDIFIEFWFFHKLFVK